MTQSTHPCGVVFLDKPKGWTSRQAVNYVIRCFALPGQRNRKQRPKAGHAGTLDPLATGMLPILLGEATRFASMGLNAEKSYEVTLDLSFQTNTLDLEGEVIDTYQVSGLTEQLLLNTLQNFIGIQQQVPPAFSAIKVDGKRAFSLARRGEDVQLQAREVEVKSIRLLHFSGTVMTLAVDCSKGTYIRSLAKDIGHALGYGGCVTMLHRTSSGGWPPTMMVTVEALAEKKEGCIVPLQTWLHDLPEVILPVEDAKRFVLGQRLPFAQPVPTKPLLKIVCETSLLGTAVYAAGILQPQRVLPSAQEKFK